MMPSSSNDYIYHKILNLIAHPICIMQISDGKFEFVNPAFCSVISPNFLTLYSLLTITKESNFAFNQLSALNESNTHVNLFAVEIATSDGKYFCNTLIFL